MNRKIALRLLTGLVLATICTSTLLYLRSVSKSNEISLDFDFEDIHGIKMNEVPGNKKILMIFFNTQCDLCLAEIPLIRDNLEQIQKHYHLVFVSFEPANSLTSFFKQYTIHNSRNISIISDRKIEILNHYGIDSYPSFLLFDKDRSIMRRGGAITIQTIAELLSD